MLVYKSIFGGMFWWEEFWRQDFGGKIWWERFWWEKFWWENPSPEPYFLNLVTEPEPLDHEPLVTEPAETPLNELRSLNPLVTIASRVVRLTSHVQT